MNDDRFHALIEHWLAEKRLAPLDARLGHFIGRRSGHPELGVLAALISRRQHEGHVCLERNLPPDDLDGIDQALWETLWQVTERATPPWLADPVRGDRPWAPLVLEHDALWLGRLRAAEQAVADAILARCLAEAHPVDEALLDTLFPAGAPDTSDEQRAAARLAAERRFAIITGGPGTGKTTTVLRVLLLRLKANPDQVIRLLAPTGKAAARLTESLNNGIERLRQDNPGLAPLLERIPREVSTIHRAIGMGRHGPRHHRHEPLVADLVVVDEASMADLGIMHRLLDALRPECDLILLGDPDQLASVEAGSVLADLVAAAGEDGPLAAHLARLTRSYRFDPERGIGRLAEALRTGDCDWPTLLEIAEGSSEVRCHPWSGSELPGKLLDGFHEDLDPARASDLASALEGLGRARILCALRQGPHGIDGLNARLAERLGQPLGRPAHGQPVLVTRNAPALGVYNGDMGVFWRHESDDRLRACFPARDGLLALPVQELPDHQPAWALTVHKSQGSEYDRILLVLPPEPHPLVTRELIYTAVTRARREVTIIASPETWEQGVATRTRRSSRLRQRLHQGSAIA